MDSDDFAIKPDEVKQASEGYEWRYPALTRQYEQAGMDPLAPVWAAFNMGGGAQAPGGARASASSASSGSGKEASLYSSDAEFYANDVGDLTAAETLLRSKTGTAAFQFGETFEFDEKIDKKSGKVAKSAFAIVPHGNRLITLPDGRRINVSVKDLAMNRKINGVPAPVRTVPFKGGDEVGQKFRSDISASMLIMSNLAKLERLYDDNPTFLTNWGYSEDGSKAKALENEVVLQMTRLLTDAKGLGGGTSENDRTFLEAIAPRRANNTFTRLGANEKALLLQARQLIKDKLKAHANANGVDLMEINRTSIDDVNRRMNAYSKPIKK